MTEFYWVLFGVALVVLFFVVGWAIDNYRELVRLRKTYDTKAEQSVIIYEAMLSLIREFNKEENGQKIFWGRGNGWVLAGLALVLSELPNDYPERQKYIKLYTDMTKRIISLQDENGMWHPSLLDTTAYPVPETSATALIGYAIAWGINNGILPESYSIGIQKTWKSVMRCVQSDGKLGYVQPIGADPKHITKYQTEVYGVGAFLLFGSEIYKMQ